MNKSPEKLFLKSFPGDFYVLSYNIRKPRLFDLLHILNTLTSQFVSEFTFYTDSQLFCTFKMYLAYPLHSQTRMLLYRCLRCLQYLHTYLQ